MAKHLKNVITPEIPDTYEINPMFENISNEEEIRKGVLAFKNFLYQLCDVLIVEGDSYDIHKKNAHEFDDRVTISVYFLDKRLKCNVEIKDLWIKIKYSYKSKEIWGINVSLNNGYQINIKAKNTLKYADTIEKFPSFIQEMIEKGYGCGIKRGISDHCNGGCQGFRFSLDDSIIDIRNAIETWLDTELSYV